VKRRDFITLLAGAAAWPLAARGQERKRMRRIGVLSEFATDRPATRASLLEFRQALEQLGWSEDRNVVDAIALEHLIRDSYARVEWGHGRILVRDGADAGWINYMLKDRQKSAFDGFLDCIIIESSSKSELV
jgi:hypothetical protein